MDHPFDRKADEIVRRSPEQVGDCSIDPQPAAIGRKKRNPDTRLFEAAMELLHALSAAVLGVPAFENLSAQLDLRHHGSCKILQQRDVAVRPKSRRLVGYAESADGVALPSYDGDAGVSQPA